MMRLALDTPRASDGTQDGVPEFPVDAAYLGPLRKRVNLAIEIDKAEHRVAAVRPPARLTRPRPALPHPAPPCPTPPPARA